eukprot:jgi/Botrbrau1/16991/Bobra.49_2s0050.1
MDDTKHLSGLVVSDTPVEADVTGAIDGIRTAEDAPPNVRKVERRASIDGRAANNYSSYIDYKSAGYYEGFAPPSDLPHVDSAGNLIKSDVAFPEAGLQTVKALQHEPQPDRGESELDGTAPIAQHKPIGNITVDDEEKDGYRPTSYYKFASKTDRGGMNASNSVSDLTGAA